jgi:hypothetical protein
VHTSDDCPTREEKFYGYGIRVVVVCLATYNANLLTNISHSELGYWIQINQPTKCNNFTSLLLDVYVWLNMFRAPLRQSSGVYNCTRSLWFYHWSVVGRGQAGYAETESRTPSPHNLSDHDQKRTLQPPRSNGRTRGS